MKKFKNSFGVKGSPSLLQALKEEAEKLGWKYDKDFNSGYSKRNPDLYFNANKPKDAMKPQHFSFSNVGNCIIYNLPEQWDDCLKAASELEEEIPEYVEFIFDNFSHFTKGTIYPLNKNGDCQGDNGEYHRAMQYPKDKKFMVPSTKEAYEKQELLEEARKRYPVGTVFIAARGDRSSYSIPKDVYFRINSDGAICIKDRGNGTVYFNGNWAEIVFKPEEPIEIAGYSVKFEDDKVSIGCYKDITLKDLKTMKKAIKVASKFGKDLTITEDSVIDNTEDSAIFLNEIEQLIERLDG